MSKHALYLEYIYDVEGGNPLVLNNPTSNNADDFGSSVAISGARLVIGARESSFSVNRAGRAYLFDLTSTQPAVPVQILNNPTPAIEDNFGRSVAIVGSKVVVGAPLDDTVTQNAGSAYVFEMSSATPTVPITILNSPSPSTNDLFGSSVAISGPRVAVGSRAGLVSVHDLASATPTVPLAVLTGGGGAEYGNYPPLAISGDRVVVGTSPFYFYGNSFPGSAQIYDLSSPNPAVPVWTLREDQPGPFLSPNAFGFAVALSGNLVAAADTSLANNSGKVFVYNLASSNPTVAIHVLENPTSAAFDRFGNCLALFGTWLVVAAADDSDDASQTGKVYAYDLASSTPTIPAFVLHNPTPGSQDRFGSSLAISGTRVVVGAWEDDTFGANQGTVYVYDLSSPLATTPVAVLGNPKPDSSLFFGTSVAISGTRVVVGTTTGVDAVYVYELSSSTPTVPATTIENPSPSGGDYFGNSVGIDGTTVVVGAPRDFTIATNKGAAYIFGPNANDLDGDDLPDVWELTHWGTTVGHAADDDDDADGLVALEELAFGLNPMLPDAVGQPIVTTEGGYLAITLTKRPGATYEVQSAGTLMPYELNSFSAASTVMLIDNATTLKVRDEIAIGAQAARFLRVKVKASP